jgi:hypothetical protein
VPVATLPSHSSWYQASRTRNIPEDEKQYRDATCYDYKRAGTQTPEFDGNGTTQITITENIFSSSIPFRGRATSIHLQNGQVLSIIDSIFEFSTIKTVTVTLRPIAHVQLDWQDIEP